MIKMDHTNNDGWFGVSFFLNENNIVRVLEEVSQRKTKVMFEFQNFFFDNIKIDDAIINLYKINLYKLKIDMISEKILKANLSFNHRCIYTLFSVDELIVIETARYRGE